MQGAISLSWAAAFLYLVYGALILRVLRSPQATAGHGLLYGAVLALLLHGLSVYQSVFSNETVMFGFGLATSLALFAASLVVIVESFIRRVTVLMGFVLLLAAPAALLPSFFPGVEFSLDASLSFKTHLVFAFLAYGFTIDAGVQAVLLSVMFHQMRHPSKSMSFGWLSNMPDLLAMERVLFRIVACAFLCLCGVIFFGTQATNEHAHGLFGFDHKTILTWIAWAVFAVLLIGRHWFGWRGKKALCWFWIGAVALAVAYLVYRFLVEFAV